MANLSTPGASYGGWESSNVEVRGQFIGHYLSALAFSGQNTGTWAARGGEKVTGLAAEGKGDQSAGVPEALPTPRLCSRELAMGPRRMQGDRSSRNAAA